MCDVGMAVVRKRAGQIFVRAGTGFEDVKLMGSEWGGAQEGVKEAGQLGRIQGGWWGHWRVTWFAFIPESGLCL